MKKVIAGLIGLNLIILIHELGHFLAAHYYGVATPTFSLGFGPALITIPLTITNFQIACIPIGGYVELNQTQLSLQPYYAKMIIICAGILCNFLLSFIIVRIIKLRNYITREDSLPNIKDKLISFIITTTDGKKIIGPLTILDLLGKSSLINQQMYWLMIAVLSSNVGIFNAIPLPPLDGGKAVTYTAECIIGSSISLLTSWLINLLLIFIIVFLIVFITPSSTKKRTPSSE